MIKIKKCLKDLGVLKNEKYVVGWGNQNSLWQGIARKIHLPMYLPCGGILKFLCGKRFPKNLASPHLGVVTWWNFQKAMWLASWEKSLPHKKYFTLTEKLCQ